MDNKKLSILLIETAELLNEGIFFNKNNMINNNNLTEKALKKYDKIFKLKCKNNNLIYLLKCKNKKSNDGSEDFDIYLNNKRIGFLFLESHEESLYINWISINAKYQNNGYASRIIDWVLSYGKSNGYKYSTLETHKDDLNAIHIYKKKGYHIDKINNENDLIYFIKKL